MTGEEPAIVATRPQSPIADRLLRWEVILALMLAAVFVANSIATPWFLDIYNLADATYNFSEKAIIASESDRSGLALALPLAR